MNAAKQFVLAVVALLVAPGAFAACAYVGEANNSSGGSASSIAVTYSPAAGDALVVFTQLNANISSGDSVTDTGRNSWTNAFHFYNANVGTITAWVEANAAGGSTTFTYSWSGSYAFGAILVVEYSGAGTSSAFVSGEYANQYQTAPGTGSNAITSGNTPTLSGVPCMVIGLNTDKTTATNYPTAGTGFTSRGNVINFGGGTSYYTFEDMPISGTSAIAATWTALAGGASDNYYTGAIVLQGPGGGSSCTHTGWNLATGNWSVPTAGVGKFLLQSGGAGPVDCSTTKYWQKSGGFGLN